ncbi:MAG: hypothetical protein ACYTDW_18780, partial [Planctomycetota bacterium]
MAICPACKGEFARRKDENCPGCGVRITLHNGRWFDLKGKNPVTLTFKKWERLMSDRLDTPFHIPEKSNRFKSEMKHIVNLLFQDPRFSWKTYSAVIQMWNDFSVALTIARDMIDKEAEEQAAME